jgi:hypothetical protein
MVKRVLDGGLAVLCFVTLISTDLANIQAADILVLACMGAAVLAKIIYVIVTRRNRKA